MCSGSNFSEEQRFNILQPQFELNPSHPLIKKLAELKNSDPILAVALTEQLFANAMVSAGMISSLKLCSGKKRIPLRQN